MNLKIVALAANAVLFLMFIWGMAEGYFKFWSVFLLVVLMINSYLVANSLDDKDGPLGEYLSLIFERKKAEQQAAIDALRANKDQ